MKYAPQEQLIPLQASAQSNKSAEERANEIIHALIQQTSQEDWDELTVDRLVYEYEQLMS